MLLHRIVLVILWGFIGCLLAVCPTSAKGDAAETAGSGEPIAKHLEFFEKLAGKPISRDALQKLTKEQNDKLVEYLVARPSRARLGYSRENVEKWPDLVLLILVSESMDEAERKYWVSLLPVMTEDQRTSLRNIVVNEREQLDDIDTQRGEAGARSSKRQRTEGSGTPRPKRNSSSGRKSPEAEKMRAGHLDFFQQLAGVKFSAKALVGLTDEQTGKLQSYLLKVHDCRRLGYNEATVSKWPDLLILMLTSESMDDAERKDWVVKLPIMNAEERAALRKILMTERDHLDAIDKKHSDELAKVSGEGSSRVRKPKTQPVEESPADRAKRRERANEHLEVFRTIATAALSAQSLSALTDEQTEKLRSYLGKLPERQRIGFTQEVVTKWPDLLLLMLTSESISEAEQKEWAEKLTLMDADQRTELRRILIEEHDAWSKEALELLNKQQTARVIEMATERLRALPADRAAWFIRGLAYYRTNAHGKAIDDFTKALASTPRNERHRALHYRGKAYREQKDYEHAIADFTEATETAKGDVLAEIHVDRGGVYQQRGKYDEAMADYGDALRSSSNDVKAIAYSNRSSMYQKNRDYGRALADRKSAMNLRRDNVDDYNELAWLMATCQDASLRDGKQAIQYARKACELTKWSDPNHFDTLAAAYAEDGQFEKAVQWQEKALAHPDFAKQLSAEDLAKARERASLYRERKPYREP